MDWKVLPNIETYLKMFKNSNQGIIILLQKYFTILIITTWEIFV